MSPEINSFITRFANGLNRCGIFDSPGNIRFAVQQAKTKKNRKIVFIGRGLDEREIEVFQYKKRARDPLLIKAGGEFKFLINMVDSQSYPIEKYSFRFVGLRKSINGIHSLRFDKDLNTPRSRNDWDDQMQDAPSHPAHHLHINFEEDNHMRLPTGVVDPLMIIASIDCWYLKVLSELY
ncbi:hypothetical protein B6I21_02730 [candidate division KSB1 bacterium 4572_119]|nr:MAG: hypothetical protein B6I21_02730 [candidate division KSB1 bacterium 4572_119]